MPTPTSPSPWTTDAPTSARLARVRHHGTPAELAVREALRELGLRYAVLDRTLPGTPDIASRAGRWAIFVHGCFWHAHRGCVRATVPVRNRDLWIAKFKRNRECDALA